MSKLLPFTAATLLLAACAGNGQPEKHSDSPMVGMSNPASEFCVKQGGKLETKKDAEGGEYALRQHAPR